MKKTNTFFVLTFLSISFLFSNIAFTQSILFSENFESGTSNSSWYTFYKNEDNVIAKPMAQAPKPLATGGNFVGWLQDTNASYTGSSVAVSGALTLKNYSIEADVYCYVNHSGGSAYTGLVVYADTVKKDFYKMRVDFDASNRINLSGLKSDTVTFVPKFNYDFKGTNNPGIFPTTDGWNKLKIEVRSTSATVNSVWCYFNGTLLSASPVLDTISSRATSGSFGLYSFQMDNNGIAAYFDNIVVTQLPTSIEDEFIKAKDFALFQNYPNPFNPETQITYKLSSAGFVSLQIYDLLGNKIKTLISMEQSSGYHSLSWNGKDDLGNIVPSGVYFYSIRSGNSASTKKMVVLR